MRQKYEYEVTHNREPTVSTDRSSENSLMDRTDSFWWHENKDVISIHPSSVNSRLFRVRGAGCAVIIKFTSITSKEISIEFFKTKYIKADKHKLIRTMIKTH